MKLRFSLQAGILIAVSVAAGRKANADSITHSFLATGAETYIRAGDGRILWRYPGSTRDGWVLPNGNILLAVSKGEDYPGGAVVEVTRDGKKVFEFKGTQSEVNTAQALSNGTVMLTEAGDRPRILEVDRRGTIVVEVPLSCQTTNHHMETRMSRKLANGNYLVPQLLDQVVREYAPSGKIVWEVKTPHWPFTAIRLPNGNTLIDCTRGDLVIEVDASGKTVWELSNRDLPKALIKDACGASGCPMAIPCSPATESARTKRSYWKSHRTKKWSGPLAIPERTGFTTSKSWTRTTTLLRELLCVKRVEL